MDELAGTENRIAVARQRYNDAARQYNTLRRSFPSNVTAKMFGFKEYKYFEAPPIQKFRESTAGKIPM
jgi:LemA protein